MVRYIFLLGVSALVATPTMAQTIIGAKSAVINSGGPGDGAIVDTYSQNGLATKYVSGVTNFDAYIAGNPRHTVNFQGFEWFSNRGTTSAVVTYDLGSVMQIDRVALWNEEFAGIGLLNLLTSTNGSTFTSLGNFVPTDNPPVSTSVTDYGADVFSFATTMTRYVRFSMSQCPQPNGNNYTSCSIGEVAFRTATVNGAVPEPATWALMLAGFGAVGGAMRRRRTVATLV